MEQQETPQKDTLEYQRGFEVGYKLRMYNQELLSKIIDTFKPGDAYADGFFSGVKEAEQELQKKKDQQQEQNNERQQQLKEIRKNKEHDRGDRER